MEKPYLFIDTSVWEKYDHRNYMTLLNLDTRYRIIITEVQLEEIRKIFFGDDFKLIEFIGEDDEYSYHVFNDLQKSNPKLITLYYNFHIHLMDYIDVIVKNNEGDTDSAYDRLYNNHPPFEEISNIISWINIISSSEIENGYDLYLYTNTATFNFNGELHPVLKFDWKVHKKGLLRFFNISKPPVEYVVGAVSEKKTLIKKYTPHYMQERFNSLMNLIREDLTIPNVDIEDIQAMLKESEYLLQRLQAGIPKETILDLKRKFSIVYSRYREVLQAQEKNNKNRI